MQTVSKLAPAFEAVQQAFDAGQWSKAVDLALEVRRSRCEDYVDKGPGSPCYNVEVIRARSLAKLSRACEALLAYEHLRGAPGTPEAAELHALEGLLEQRSGPGPYPFRLVLEQADRDNLELISATVRFDVSPVPQIPPLATSFQAGCHLARVDVDIRGLKRLWGRRFTILSAHSFDAESVSMLRAVLFESAPPLYVGLRFEEVPRARPE